MSIDVKCSKCTGQMQEGLVVDLNYAGILPSMWVEASAASGPQQTMMDSKRKVKTMTYRCLDCGYLDSYAR